MSSTSCNDTLTKFKKLLMSRLSETEKERINFLTF